MSYGYIINNWELIWENNRYMIKFPGSVSGYITIISDNPNISLREFVKESQASSFILGICAIIDYEPQYPIYTNMEFHLGASWSDVVNIDDHFRCYDGVNVIFCNIDNDGSEHDLLMFPDVDNHEFNNYVNVTIEDSLSEGVAYGILI